MRYGNGRVSTFRLRTQLRFRPWQGGFRMRVSCVPALPMRTRAVSAQPIVAGIDAGGTMTDTILVDGDGHFTIGKAETTPRREADGFLESAAEAAENWGLTTGEMFRSLEVVLYSGTGMLNTLLSRTGRKLGLVTTRGMEDMVLMGRGLQTWCDYSYADRLHAVTHHHPEPLVARTDTFGVTERVDHFGDVVIPLYEREVAEAAEALAGRDLDAVCVCLLFSHVNPAHERRAGELLRETFEKAGRKADILLSHEIRPVIREQSRLNSVLIEAYATGRGRDQLGGIEEASKSNGFRHGVQTLLSFGGLVSIRHPRLHETMISGPIGGILGALHVGEAVGVDSLIVSDMGGTSFDMGVITKGQVRIENEPVMDRFKLNVPTIAMDTIGAGAGMHVKVDPLTKKVSLGPESAGSDPGPVCFGKGNLQPTVCDCDAILGWLNPDYFLGGKVRLDLDLARRMFRERCASHFDGLDIHEVAEGMVGMLEDSARSALNRILSSEGIHPSEFTLLSYGGSGPLHVAGYSRGIGFRDILTFPFAAAFSAFGCTTADYSRRHSRSVSIDLPASLADDGTVGRAGSEITSVWEELTGAALGEMDADGHPAGRVSCAPFLRMRYTGQLEDVEVLSPVTKVGGLADAERVVREFESVYEKINRRVSRYAGAGVTITELGVIARADKVKPRLVSRPLGPAKPDRRAEKGSREAYLGGRWRKASTWEMDGLAPGNEIRGPAIVEHPATTLVIHPGDHVFVDEWTMIHYRHG